MLERLENGWTIALDVSIWPRAEETFVVEEVWAIEAVQHGDSALINEGKLGVLCTSIAFWGEIVYLY